MKPFYKAIEWHALVVPLLVPEIIPLHTQGKTDFCSSALENG
jgi:hypothetical protein